MQFGTRTLNPGQPAIMAIINITPDSFSDGGLFYHSGKPDLNAVCRHAEADITEGAHILDIGGESTRPGAAPVSRTEELARVVPVIEALAQRFDTIISVDTSDPVVMQEAVAAGATLINDVRALRREGAMQAAIGASVPVCLVHMQGAPATMQQAPAYSNVVAQVREFLAQRAQQFITAGGSAEQLLLDPGFGFGKTLAQNTALFRQLNRLADLGYPLVVGVSRKTLLGQLTGRNKADRVTASAVAAALAYRRGGRILRVHDVAATQDALRVTEALL